MFAWIKNKIEKYVLNKEVASIEQKIPTSWRTSLGGIGFLCAAVAAAMPAMIDGDPSTHPDWKIVGGLLTAAWTAFNARDQKAHEIEKAATLKSSDSDDVRALLE